MIRLRGADEAVERYVQAFVHFPEAAGIARGELLDASAFALGGLHHRGWSACRSGKHGPGRSSRWNGGTSASVAIAS